ncbi:surface antigen-domain-containing protein [Russula ochroleuca]|uniref:Surface antigen-domain-containing protein n=1 Tax=Russula ochroleuca TaxID=152965 RepID=A0A9P5MWI9_9AGAM|nr:surface antigen-domain-containing protein [Russula ochroleuca]
MDSPLLDQHARINAVRVDGAKNTRRSFLASLVYPHLPQSPHSSFESVLRATRDIGHYLVQSDLFQSVHARLEPSADPAAKPGDVDVIFSTRERPRFFLKTSTEVGNSEGTASATSRIRNVFGGGETFEANVSFGTKTRRSFNATFTAPVTRTLDTHGELSVFALDRDNTSYMSATETLRGARAVIRRGAVGTRAGQHEFGYEAALRHIGGLKPTASLSVRTAAGTSTKSSLFHRWTRDTRDHPILGTRGVRAQLLHELAGLGGGAAFYKAEGSLHASRVLHPGLLLSLGARAGILHSLSNGIDGTAPTLSDRFQLGGPTNLRMFRANSLGPRDGVDSLGGDLFWAAGVSLITHLPRKPHWPVKAHAFLNAGQLEPLHRHEDGLGSSLRSSVSAALTQPSVSTGVGLIYHFDPVRVELNFGVPLAARTSDGTRKGVQVGIGLEFL